MEETSKGASTEASALKIPRVRSVAYPSNTITHCIALTERIYKIFGNITYTARSAMCAQLKISESHLQTQLSSCVQYGLLEMKTNEGYRATATFIMIYRPMDEAERKEALIKCFTSPELYAKIIEQFNHERLPAEGGLAILLYRKLKVSENASLIAAKIFLENAAELELIQDGHLDTNIPNENNQSSDQIPYIEVSVDKEQAVLPASINAKTTILSSNDAPPIPILLSDNRVAQLIMPKDYTVEDFKRVLRVVAAYLPE